MWLDRNERRDALDQRVALWILEAGFLPVAVPNILPGRGAIARWLDAVSPAAVVLSGGNDLNDAPERDRLEQSLLRFCEDNRLPVLGLCRGMQIMAAYAGGSLKRLDGHRRCRHRLTTMAPLPVEWPGEVNSFHAWGITDCPRGYTVLARLDTDESIEAMRHQSLPWEGWMWHPEREPEFSQNDLLRARTLLDG